MKATASYSSGYCAIEDGSGLRFLNVTTAASIPVEIAHLIAGTVDDWQIIQASNVEEIIKTVQIAHYRARVILNLEACLCGVSSSLAQLLLSEVEDVIKMIGNSEQFAAMLLKAPLLEPTILDTLARLCLSEGFAACASLFDKVRELQPHLRRIVDEWLSIPEIVFLPLPGGRQQAWRTAVEASVILKVINASTYSDVQKAWNTLAFISSIATERICFTKIGRELAGRLFPDFVAEGFKAEVEAEPGRQARSQRSFDRHEKFQKVMKQIEGITHAVSEGQNAQARKYLRELIAAQVDDVDGEDFAVKSLCNVAQQCAEMFRTDFEFECLKAALSIRPHDVWALIQLADHFKRVGKFVDAERTLQEAAEYGETRIAKSSLADVYVQMRRYDDAMRLYGEIPDGDSDPAVRCAKADVLRRQGLLAEASAEYMRMISDGLGEHRVYAGMADIAKKRGNIDESIRLYRSILSDPGLDGRSLFVYRMAFAQLLVRKGDLPAAYKILDEAVQNQPFARQAWAFRSAVAALLGNPKQAISDLPDIGQTHAFNEWVSEYIRGLLLLLLGRFDDAKIALFQNIRDRLLDESASEIVRLAAAVSFLNSRAGVPEAARLLEAVPKIEDAFAESIRTALQFHIAKAQRQTEIVERLKEQLENVSDTDISELVIAIDQRNWEQAWQLEVRSLLRLAA